MRIRKIACVALVSLGALTARAEVPPARNVVNKELKGETLAQVVDQLQQEHGVTITLDKGLENRTVTGSLVAVDLKTALKILAEKAIGEVIKRGDNWYELRAVEMVGYATREGGEEIKLVLQAIAAQARVSLAVSPKVEGKVFLSIAKPIPWRQALEVAAKTAGDYAVVEEDGGVLRIVPAAELKSQVEIRMFPLKWLRVPSDYIANTNDPRFIRRPLRPGAAGATTGRAPAAPTAEEDFSLLRALRAVLGEDGRIDYDPISNTLLVQTVKPKLDEIARIIQQLDVRPDQVAMEVHFVSTSDTDFLDFGIDWGGSDNGGPRATISGGRTFTRLPFNLGNGGFEDKLGIRREGPTATDINNTLKNTTDEDNPTAFPVFGLLDFTQIQAVLRFMKRDVRSRVIQRPILPTENGQPATIFVGDEVPFAQTQAASAQSGGLTFTISEAPRSPVQVGFQLLIVPHIVANENKLRLTIVPQSNTLTGTSTTQPGFLTFTSGSNSIDLPRITSRTLVTNVILESGQTVVLGGLMTSTDTLAVNKLPFFGDIPFLGWLFKNKQQSLRNENLTIFVRPEIVRSFREDSQSLAKALRPLTIDPAKGQLEKPAEPVREAPAIQDPGK